MTEECILRSIDADCLVSTQNKWVEEVMTVDPQVERGVSADGERVKSLAQCMEIV